MPNKKLYPQRRQLASPPPIPDPKGGVQAGAGSGAGIGAGAFFAGALRFGTVLFVAFFAVFFDDALIVFFFLRAGAAFFLLAFFLAFFAMIVLPFVTASVKSARLSEEPRTTQTVLRYHAERTPAHSAGAEGRITASLRSALNRRGVGPPVAQSINSTV